MIFYLTKAHSLSANLLRNVEFVCVCILGFNPAPRWYAPICNEKLSLAFLIIYLLMNMSIRLLPMKPSENILLGKPNYNYVPLIYNHTTI